MIIIITSTIIIIIIIIVIIPVIIVLVAWEIAAWIRCLGGAQASAQRDDRGQSQRHPVTTHERERAGDEQRGARRARGPARG